MCSCAQLHEASRHASRYTVKTHPVKTSPVQTSPQSKCHLVFTRPFFVGPNVAKIDFKCISFKNHLQALQNTHHIIITVDNQIIANRVLFKKLSTL